MKRFISLYSNMKKISRTVLMEDFPKKIKGSHQKRSKAKGGIFKTIICLVTPKTWIFFTLSIPFTPPPCDLIHDFHLLLNNNNTQFSILLKASLKSETFYPGNCYFWMELTIGFLLIELL